MNMTKKNLIAVVFSTIGVVFMSVLPFVRWVCNSKMTYMEVFLDNWYFIAVGVALLLINSGSVTPSIYGRKKENKRN